MSNINPYNANTINNTINNGPSKQVQAIEYPKRPIPIPIPIVTNRPINPPINTNPIDVLNMQNLKNDSYASPYTQGTTMYDNRGKFFDQREFNKNFDEYIKAQSANRLTDEKLKLNDLNSIENIKIYPYQLPLNKILINTKDTWFNLFDNIINKNTIYTGFDFDSIFYVSITLIVVALIYIMLLFIFE
jgi:hypothetical protein